ncbi:ABC transporter permease [Chloroflexota bacterium]
MDKFWLVAIQEYRNRTFKRSFIIGTLIIPMMIAIIIGVTILIILQAIDDRPFGYVDYSGTLTNASMPNDEESVKIIAFSDEESARTALEAEDIQGYHLIPEDYLNTLYVDLYYLEEAPETRVLQDFDDYMRANILGTPPTAIQVRITEGSTLTVKSMNNNREFQDNETGIIIIMLPLMIAMFFLFAIMGASGYFLQVVTDEKESRTMEIMITSISPIQLIAGKSLGLVAVGLTQILVWVISIVIAWIVALNFFETLRTIELPWEVLIFFAIFFLPSYAIIAGVMICIGSIVNELQEGQQISGVLNLLFTFPIFFAALVFANPNSPLLIFLSFWPTTSLMTIIMRWGFTVIPVWQVAMSWFICMVTGIMVIWIASRLFRLGMLRYGQRVSLKSAIRALRPGIQN